MLWGVVGALDEACQGETLVTDIEPMNQYLEANLSGATENINFFLLGSYGEAQASNPARLTYDCF